MSRPCFSVFCDWLWDRSSITAFAQALRVQSMMLPQIEVLLIPDVSSRETLDELLDLVREFDGRYLGHLEGEAPAIRRQAAIGSARGEFLVFLGRGVLPQDDFFETLEQRHRRNQEAMVVESMLELSPASNSSFLDSVFYRSGFLHSNCTTRSVPSSLFLSENIFFDDRFLSSWGVDRAFEERLKHSAVQILKEPRLRTEFSYASSLGMFLEQEIMTKIDLASFLLSTPELTEELIGVFPITSGDVSKWKTMVEDDAPFVGGVLEQLDAACSQSNAQVISKELVEGCDEALKRLSQFIERRELVRSFLALDDFAPIQFNKRLY